MWPEDTKIQILIAIIGSLLVLPLIYLFHIIWDKVLLKKILYPIMYRHTIDISGQWSCELIDVSGHRCYWLIELKQSGMFVSGTEHYEISFKDTENKQTKNFILQGVIKNDILVIYYYNIDKRQKGIGTYTLSVAKDGRQLRGKFAWYDVEIEKIDTGDLSLNRLSKDNP